MDRNYIKLTDKDKKALEEITKECLKPLVLDVSITDEIMVFHSWVRSGNYKKKWDEYCYKIEVKQADDSFLFFESFKGDSSIFDAGWHLAWQIFKKLKLDFHGPVGTTLWDRRNHIKEKYKELKWSSA